MNTAIKKVWKNFRYISVAERQKRGAWHFHVLGNIEGLPSLNCFLKFVRSFSVKSSIPFGFCKCIWTYGKDYKGVAAYMVKYMTKQVREKGVRLVNYSRNWFRKVSLPFSWLNGSSAKWRESCTKIDATFPVLFKYIYRNSKFKTKLDLIDLEQSGNFLELKEMIFYLGRKIFPGVPDYREEVLTFSRVSTCYSKSYEFSFDEDIHFSLKKDFFSFSKYGNMVPEVVR